MVKRYDTDPETAAHAFYIFDKDGLITQDRANLTELEENFPKIR